MVFTARKNIQVSFMATLFCSVDDFVYFLTELPFPIGGALKTSSW